MASHDETPALSYAPVVGRRRTRAAAQIEIQERREQFKRRAAASRAPVSVNPTARLKAQAAAGSPTAARVVVGASMSERSRDVVIERTPTKAALQSPPQARHRQKPAPQAVVPTPEKTVIASAGVEPVDSINSRSGSGLLDAVKETHTDETMHEPTATDALVVQTKRVAARSIAQSSSSVSTRKRMISFSPERDERPENRALALLKLEKNLKATAKLQERLDGVDVRARNDEQPQPQPRSAFTTPSKKPLVHTTQPSPFTNPLRTPVKKRSADGTPVKLLDTPSAPTNQTLELISDDESGAVDGSAGGRQELLPMALFTPVKAAPSPAQSDRRAAGTEAAETTNERLVRGSSQDGNDDEDETAAVAPLSQVDAGDDVDCCPTQELYSQFSEAESAPPLSCSQEPSQQQQQQQVDHVVDFSLASSTEFTSTSVIEDVGLFNCDVDVEYTGGVYGEGTDGKVSAAVIGGQKVALKRAKPHDGFPDDEAKRRSAVELHYLRKVRHMQGFIQCLGLCDGIEHTCIALEVMDCKLSDYLRRYGRSSGASSSRHSGGATTSASKRRYTLSLDEAKGLLRQIALPMMLLHDQVNVAHGDLACRNILLRTPPKGYEKRWEPVVKLSDFGRIKLPSSEPKILDASFSFFKNCDVGSFGREVLYRFLVGEIVPSACLETRSLHKQLQDLVVKHIPEDAKERLGPYYRLFMRCTAWGVRPTFREIYEHLDDLEYFEMTENGLFPLKPSGGAVPQPALDASFLSPDGSRAKFVSSGSKGKFETPNGSLHQQQQRTSTGAPRLLQSKSTDGGATTTMAAAAAVASNKTVNLLKARSVLRNTPYQVLGTGGAATEIQKGNQPPRSLAPPSGFTPNGRPMLLKKTPPSAGASRRSLQILSQIQHRTDTGAK